MHGSFLKSLYYGFSGIIPKNNGGSLSFEFIQDQGEDVIGDESEFSIDKPSVFEFAGQNEMTILSPKKGMAVECAWPELLYRKLVLGFLGVIFFAFLVNAF